MITHMMRLLGRWPLTLIAATSLAAAMLIAANQARAAAVLPDAFVVVIVPAYALSAAAIMATGLRLPWSLLVIVPAVLALDSALFFLRQKVSGTLRGIGATRS